jgi:thymidine kinase
MSYGLLKVNAGPMFAGKSEALIRDILFQTYFDHDGEGVCVFKPAFDTRFDKEEIVTHNGKSVKAIPLSEPDVSIIGDYKHVFFDEVQFFTQPHFSGDFLKYIRDLREGGCDVYCSGLDMDAQGNSFEITGALMAESSDLRRLTARCERCGSPATRTARTSGAGPRVDLGTSDKYEPLCLEHWVEAQLR